MRSLAVLLVHPGPSGRMLSTTVLRELRIPTERHYTFVEVFKGVEKVESDRV